MILKWNKASVTKIAGQFIYPGVNNLPDDKRDEILKSPWVKEKMEMSPPIIEIIEKTKEKPAVPVQGSGTNVVEEPTKESVDDEVTDDITEMSVKDAISVVKETLILADLEEMKKKETRKSVSKVIDKQIEILESEPESEKEGE